MCAQDTDSDARLQVAYRRPQPRVVLSSSLFRTSLQACSILVLNLSLLFYTGNGKSIGDAVILEELAERGGV